MSDMSLEEFMEISKGKTIDDVVIEVKKLKYR